MKPLKLSRSKLDEFLLCPRCFWLDIHGKGPPAGIPMGIYIVIDSLQKKYYDKYRSKGLPPMLKNKLPFKLADEKLVNNFRKNIEFRDDDLNAILFGKMDDCFVDDEGKLVVIDNKTSSGEPSEEFEESYKFQLETYAFLLKKNGFKVNENGYLIYYIIDRESDFENGIKFKVKPKKFKLNTEHIHEIFREAVLTARSPNPPKAHEECEMCLWLHSMDDIENINGSKYKL